MQNRALLFLIPLMLFGCRLHVVDECPFPCQEVEEVFFYDQPGVPMEREWWKEFEDEELNQWMAAAFCGNLELRQAWDRLRQARADVCIARSQKFPQVSLNPNVTQTKSYGNRQSAGFNFSEESIGIGSFNDGTFTRYSLAAFLTYEVDLWRKIDSEVNSACYSYRASKEDIDATALILSGSLFETWYTVEAQRALIKVIRHQIEVNLTQLELIELRYTVGQSSALDVYQQRLQLAATESQLPPALALLETSANTLYSLIGQTPDGSVALAPKELDYTLPPFPCLGSPWDLVLYRPDLRRAQNELVSADFDVGAAIADRFPQLNFDLSYTLSAAEWSNIFDREVFGIAGNIVQPLIDGNRRKCEVDKRRAIVCERLHAFGNSFLTAIQEVEDAVVQERHQIDLIRDLERQLEISQKNLMEAQIRYLNGLNDYLTVIAAIQSKQNLERQIINEKKELLIIRSQLYLALGGAFTLAH